MYRIFPRSAYICKNIIEQRTFSIHIKRNIFQGSLCYLPNYAVQLETFKKLNIFMQNQRYFASINSEIRQSVPPLQSKRRVPKKKVVQLDDENENTFNVMAFCTAEEYDLESLSQAIIKQDLYVQSAMPDDVQDVLHVSSKYQIDKEPSEVYFFREGCVVFWNITETERHSILKFLAPYSRNSYSDELIWEESEHLDYFHADNATRLVNGNILLSSEDSTDLEKYAFSNGIALSVRLAVWEASLSAFVESIEPVTEDMKNRQKISMTREEVFTKTAELYALRHIINLSSDLLDTPDFYWDRENLENLYQKTCNHLNVSKRTKVMNEKLTYCCELMQLINDHLNDHHHVRLEIMIIVLIMIEVVFEIIHTMKE